MGELEEKLDFLFYEEELNPFWELVAADGVELNPGGMIGVKKLFGVATVYTLEL